MQGSNFGKAFQITTFGESHGKGLGVIIQGCPPGISLDEETIQKALDKRKPGNSISSTRRKEPDVPIFYSGIFEGKTTGTPLMILINNKDAESKSYEETARLFRPGHGDYTYQAKYGIRDYRGGGRSSARETAARVSAGAVAQLILDQQGICITSYTLEIGGIKAENITEIWRKDDNDLQCPDPKMAQQMSKCISQVKADGDSLGGVVEIRASGVPKGLGEPVFDKLDADIAKAFMSIGAVKAVEIGEGCHAPKLSGFENNDQITEQGFETNHSGGILAGISNGEDIIARVHVKPIPSILREQQTLDKDGNSAVISTKGRHDICAIPRINKVCEAMLAITLADHYLRQKANI